jgi:phosphatidylinositol alpha-1,6-mannosyltransferase
MTSQALRRRDEASADAIPGAHSPVLLLTPSRGLGGGIERYVETVQSAFDAWGVAHRRLDLLHRGPGSHRALLSEATVALAESAEATQVIVAHRALLPVAALLARIRPVRGISVICHGIDVWGKRSSLRWQLESRLMRRPGVRIVAVSSFTAGSLFPVEELVRGAGQCGRRRSRTARQP